MQLLQRIRRIGAARVKQTAKCGPFGEASPIGARISPADKAGHHSMARLRTNARFSRKPGSMEQHVEVGGLRHRWQRKRTNEYLESRRKRHVTDSTNTSVPSTDATIRHTSGPAISSRGSGIVTTLLEFIRSPRNPRCAEYSSRYGNGVSVHMNIAITSPSSLRSASRPEAVRLPRFQELEKTAEREAGARTSHQADAAEFEALLEGFLVRPRRCCPQHRAGKSDFAKADLGTHPGHRAVRTTDDADQRHPRRGAPEVPAGADEGPRSPQAGGEYRELPFRLTPDLGGNPLFRRRRVCIILVLSGIEPAD